MDFVTLCQFYIMFIVTHIPSIAFNVLIIFTSGFPAFHL